MLARVRVPAGRFLMGSSGGRDDEQPRHPVYLDAFEIALTPVTNEQYAAFLADVGGEDPPWWREPEFRGANKPVVGVNWFEARRFCGWLATKTGLAIRLPTEAEREKAARGGRRDQRFPWGDAVEGGGHSRIEGPWDGPEPVARLAPNGLGLYNMADNVHEWCLDGYDARFYEISPAANPLAPGTARLAARGGSWRHAIAVTPTAGRSSLPPEFHYSDFGFRWVNAPLRPGRPGR